MSLRSFYRYVEGFNKRRKHEKESRLHVAALQTAEVLTFINGINTEKGKSVKQVKPSILFNAWTGKAQENDTEQADRIKRANARHMARIEREKTRRKAA